MSYYKRGITKGTASKAAYQAYRAKKMASRKSRYTSKRNQPNYKALRKNTGEKKGMDTLIGSATIIDTTTTNGSCTVLNLVQQGSGSWNRIGRQIYLKSVRIRGVINCAITTTTTPWSTSTSTCRMVLVWDKQPSGGTIPTWDTIFGVTAQDGTESSTVTSNLRYDNMGRFQVLRDVILTCENIQSNLAVNANNVAADMQIDEYVKLGNRTTIYQGQNTPMTIADISTGALYLFFRDCSTGTANTWTTGLDLNARLRYTD